MNVKFSGHGQSDNGAWLVSRIAGADQLPYEMSRRDAEADTVWVEMLLGRMGIGAGDTVLIGYPSSQGGQWWPWLQGVYRRHATFASAMPSPYDGSRWGMYLRRFDLRAVIGLNSHVLQGLASVGEDVRTLLTKSSVLIAEPDAIAQLRDWGLEPWCLLNLGPAFALQPPGEEGALYNAAEWLLETLNDEIVISSQPGRLCEIKRLPTGLRGSIVQNEHGEMRLLVG